jgi:hypothetical protein
MNYGQSILGESPLPQKYCYENHTPDFASYYLVPDAPSSITIPLDNRPTWKGVGAVPNQRPNSLLIQKPRDRLSVNQGFIPHTGEYSLFSRNVDNESSLKNLDYKHSKGQWNQRMFAPNSNLFNEASQANERTAPMNMPNPLILKVSPFESEVPTYAPTRQGVEGTCGFSRRYESQTLNQSLFNNHTRNETKKLQLPYAKKRISQQSRTHEIRQSS